LGALGSEQLDRVTISVHGDAVFLKGIKPINGFSAIWLFLNLNLVNIRDRAGFSNPREGRSKAVEKQGVSQLVQRTFERELLFLVICARKIL